MGVLEIELDNGKKVRLEEAKRDDGVIEQYVVTHWGDSVRTFEPSEVQDAIAWTRGYAEGANQTATHEPSKIARLVSLIKRLTP